MFSAFAFPTTDAAAENAKALREKAMAYLDTAANERDPKRKAHLLKLATDGISESYRFFFATNDELQRAVTLGYKGRVHLIAGERINALVYMTKANDLLQFSNNEHGYELENLLWLVKVTRGIDRHEVKRRIKRFRKK